MSMPIIKCSGIKRKESITDIVESVALEQTALSHILNAEGEKIQKVLEICDFNKEKCNNCDTDNILKVNESVQTTINAVTRLETVLHGKLELFKNCLCDDNEVKPLELLIKLSEINCNNCDTTKITIEGNVYTIKLMNSFPRTITFSGHSNETITTIKAKKQLPDHAILTNNMLTINNEIELPFDITLEVKLENNINSSIYIIKIN